MTWKWKKSRPYEGRVAYTNFGLEHIMKEYHLRDQCLKWRTVQTYITDKQVGRMQTGSGQVPTLGSIVTENYQAT
jgi:hypothetical protein